MRSRNSFSAKERAEIFERCQIDGESFPVCTICGFSVAPGQQWDVAHVGAPAALGGTEVGIAHRRCNREEGARVVTPLVAKTKRIREKHTGAREQGRGRRAMPCGRDSGWKKRIDGTVVRRG